MARDTQVGGNPCKATKETARRSGPFLGYYREERTRARPRGGFLRHEFDRLDPVETGLTLARLWHHSGTRATGSTAKEPRFRIHRKAGAIANLERGLRVIATTREGQRQGAPSRVSLCMEPGAQTQSEA
jgi:hypothetical protein